MNIFALAGRQIEPCDPSGGDWPGHCSDRPTGRGVETEGHRIESFDLVEFGGRDPGEGKSEAQTERRRSEDGRQRC